MEWAQLIQPTALKRQRKQNDSARLSSVTPTELSSRRRFGDCKTKPKFIRFPILTMFVDA
jgi:hypothetical protein